MVALQKWNGGVIIISHDERFITTVAKEVWLFDWVLLMEPHRVVSSGSVETTRLPSSKAMYRCTRYVFFLIAV